MERLRFFPSSNIAVRRRRRGGSISDAFFSVLFVLLYPAAFLVVVVRGFSSSSVAPPPNVVVYPASTRSDVLDLADLRYDEWIAGGNENREPANPSREAFRVATADIFDERTVVGGAVCLLAKLRGGGGTATTSGRRGGAVVGSAELSPVEFEGCVSTAVAATTTNLYVTDVVCKSSHRRIGVGGALMAAVETEAKAYAAATSDLGSASGRRRKVALYLLVHESNEPAMKFYCGDKLGYAIPTEEELRGGDEMIDVDRFAENAGATGQVLLRKVLEVSEHDVSKFGLETERGEEGGNTRGGTESPLSLRNEMVHRHHI